METVRSSETSVKFYQSTRYNFTAVRISNRIYNVWNMCGGTQTSHPHRTICADMAARCTDRCMWLVWFICLQTSAFLQRIHRSLTCGPPYGVERVARAFISVYLPYFIITCASVHKQSVSLLPMLPFISNQSHYYLRFHS
jgi:hypothetical protein